MSLRSLPKVSTKKPANLIANENRVASAVAASLSHVRAAPRNDGDIGAIAESLGETREVLATSVRSMSDFGKEVKAKIADFEANQRALEQTVARMESGGARIHMHGAGPSIGAVMMEEAAESQALQMGSLKAWNQGTVRLKHTGSINAVLVNDGNGGVGDTEYATPAERIGVRMPVMRPLRLIEALPSRPVTSDSIEYVQLNTAGAAAEQEKEGDNKAAVTFTGELLTASIATIAAQTTASRQVLDDNGALSNQIDTVLRFKTLDRLENRIINGTGGQGRILGLIPQATAFTPTLATAPADVLGEAITKMANLGFSPSLVILNPLDWFQLAIQKDGDGNYMFGSPTTPQAPGLWNTRIVLTSSIAAGSALVLDTNYVNVLDRQQPSVLLSNSHADYFVRNLVMILGELRAGLEVANTTAVQLVTIEFST